MGMPGLLLSKWMKIEGSGAAWRSWCQDFRQTKTEMSELVDTIAKVPGGETPVLTPIQS